MVSKGAGLTYHIKAEATKPASWTLAEIRAAIAEVPDPERRARLYAIQDRIEELAAFVDRLRACPDCGGDRSLPCDVCRFEVAS